MDAYDFDPKHEAYSLVSSHYRYLRITVSYCPLPLITSHSLLF
jgi:hypothetical protein